MISIADCVKIFFEISNTYNLTIYKKFVLKNFFMQHPIDEFSIDSFETGRFKFLDNFTNRHTSMTSACSNSIRNNERIKINFNCDNNYAQE